MWFRHGALASPYPQQLSAWAFNTKPWQGLTKNGAKNKIYHWLVKVSKRLCIFIGCGMVRILQKVIWAIINLIAYYYFFEYRMKCLQTCLDSRVIFALTQCIKCHQAHIYASEWYTAPTSRRKGGYHQYLIFRGHLATIVIMIGGKVVILYKAQHHLLLYISNKCFKLLC